MEKFFFGVLAGMFLCIIAIATVHTLSGQKEEERKQFTMLKDCQKDLPRSQNCVLIAVPQLVLDLSKSASKESKEK